MNHVQETKISQTGKGKLNWTSCASLYILILHEELRFKPVQSSVICSIRNAASSLFESLVICWSSSEKFPAFWRNSKVHYYSLSGARWVQLKLSFLYFSFSLPFPPTFPKWSFPSRFLKQHFSYIRRRLWRQIQVMCRVS